MRKKDYITEMKERWEAPEENDARLLGMPVIPPQLFFMAPRNFMGPKAWNTTRKKCYEDAGYKCEVCGYQGTPGKRDYSAHEVYSTDYKTGECEFIRPVCLCPFCHYYLTHVSRSLTEFKHGNPIYSAERMLEAAENGFKVIEEWNSSHSEEEKIRKHSAMLEWLREEELAEPLDALIKKYHIEFYSTPRMGKDYASWEEWHLLYNGKKYMTPYKDMDDLTKRLKKEDKKIKRFETPNRMNGGVFEEVDNLINKENKTCLERKLGAEKAKKP